MPPKGSPYRVILILLAAAFLIIPAAVIFLSDSINLTGSAVQQTIDPDEEPDSPTGDAGGAAESESEDEQDEAPADDGGDDQPEDASGEAPEQPEEPREEIRPTAAPQPTQTPAPSVETDDRDAEATEQPAAESESDDEDQSEATEEPESISAPPPEATEEPEFEPTPAPEATEEPAFEATAEATAEVTPEPVALDVTLVCGPGGVEFTVIHTGAGMDAAEAYRIDGETAGEFQLAAGESLTIAAGFGTPLFSAASVSAQPEEPCLPPPVLEVSAVCTAEMGAVFSIRNNGGPMPDAQDYTLDEQPAGEFQLGEGETAQIEAGYGSPVFASGDLSAALEEACNPPGSISGVIWLDTNGDGARADDEAAIEGVNIRLIASDGGTQEARSDADGRYEFIHLLPGDYTVRVDSPPERTRPAYDADGEPDSRASITVGFEHARADFGYQPLGSISGVIWHDGDGDAARSDDEPGIAGVGVTLTTSAGGIQETTSADDGSYVFTDLPYGDYTVTVTTPPDEMLATYDPDGQTDNRASVRLNSASASADFGYQPQPAASISGVVWADLNGDGLRGDDEPGLDGIPVTLAGAETEAQALSSASGAYQFADLPAGDYRVFIAGDVLGENFVLTTGSPAAVTLADTPTEALDFGLQPTRLGAISGLIWLETGDFGVRNSGETGIAGVVIELLDSGGSVLQTVAVAADGRYQFAELLPGTYTVRINEESLPDRLFVTFNPDGSGTFSTQVVLPPGADADQIDFGLVGAF